MVQKCINCAETMTPYYARNGAVIFICPNVKLTIKQQGLLSYGFEFCTTLNHELNPLMINPQEARRLYVGFKALHDAFKIGTSTLTLQNLRDSTCSTISDIELLKNTNLALMLEIPESQICTLFENALRLGYAVGLKSQKAIESLSKGLARQSRLILDNLGISFRAETANAWFKKERNFEKLNAEQKKEAWKTYAVERIKEKAKSLKIVSEKATHDRASARIENLKVEYGRSLRQ